MSPMRRISSKTDRKTNRVKNKGELGIPQKRTARKTIRKEPKIVIGIPKKKPAREKPVKKEPKVVIGIRKKKAVRTKPVRKEPKVVIGIPKRKPAKPKLRAKPVFGKIGLFLGRWKPKRKPKRKPPRIQPFVEGEFMFKCWKKTKHGRFFYPEPVKHVLKVTGKWKDLNEMSGYAVMLHNMVFGVEHVTIHVYLKAWRKEGQRKMRTPETQPETLIKYNRMLEDYL